MHQLSGSQGEPCVPPIGPVSFQAADHAVLILSESAEHWVKYLENFYNFREGLEKCQGG